ncbi:collagen alpha-2(I) chain-like isoform X1 [Colias croceus]|uniref:collagen alpha-2(I) chain-like isoform X1 n=1 Tax=Colias crocea TaxID=72248 RepID=UPI001E279F75|nr:collagen alpha-2(I) chain-like isoform X1 [Colias croceus]
MKLLIGGLLLLTGVFAERWQWPDADQAESVRIDTKVRFIDKPTSEREHRSSIQQDEDAAFKQPTDTEGFYNQPPGAGRFPVKSERSDNYQDSRNSYRNQLLEAESTVDMLQYCKCEYSPNCNLRSDYSNACGANQYLCCYTKPNKVYPQNSEFFNEVNDERLRIYPGQEYLAGPFPPPTYNPNYSQNNERDRNRNPGILVGPEGPTGNVGPHRPIHLGSSADAAKPVLVGPEGPTGIIGPNENTHQNYGQSGSAQRGVLVGPGGPTGIIGPAYNRPVLVGPGGPTGIIGPRRPGILVGPGGPTGIIGPKRQGVLVGPGGPTGIIGPAGINRPSNGPGILVGPGGPTGIIGPGRQILVGPNGPTGHIGPRNSYGK